MKSIICILLFTLFLSGSYTQPKNWKGKTENKNGVTYIYNQPEYSRQFKNIQAKKILSIGSESASREYLFGYIAEIKTDEEENIYVCDQIYNRISIFDKKGKFKYAFGREGKGPGDLSRPTSIALCGNKIYVHDDLNFRISVFNKGGKFDKAIILKKITFHMGADNYGNVYLTNDIGGMQDKCISVFDYQGKSVYDFCEPILIAEKDPYGDKRFAAVNIGINNNLAFVCFLYPNIIQVFEKGMLKKTINTESRLVSKPEIFETDFTSDGKKSRVKTMGARISRKDIFVLNDNRIAVVMYDKGTDFKNNSDNRNFETILNIYDKEGYLIDEFMWDWRRNGIIRHIDNKGRVYTDICKEGIPGVSIWEVNLF